MKNLLFKIFILEIVLVTLSGCGKGTSGRKATGIKKIVTSAQELIGANISSLSNEEINGLYRFQGIKFNYSTNKENNKNVEYVWGCSNYICFGTYDQEECLKNTDKYMYQIIGVNNNGGLRLIKSEPLTYLTWNNDNKNILWKDSNVFSYLNSDNYLNNNKYINDEWRKKIVESAWKYGTLTSEDYEITGNGYYDGKKVLSKEESWSSSVMAKIGLIYPSDYYFAATKNINGIKDENYKEFEKSWMNSNEFEEFTIASIKKIIDDGHCYVLVRGKSGMLSYSNCDRKNGVRPVFNTIDNIEFISGTGSNRYPFIIKK